MGAKGLYTKNARRQNDIKLVVISEKLPELESIMNERTLFSSGNKSIRSTQPTETCFFQSGGGCKTIKLCIGSDRQALNGCIGGVKLKYRLLA